MAVAYGASGAIVYSTGNPAPAYPTGITAGQLLVLEIRTKPDNTPATTPAGWTLLGAFAGGTGTTGIDVGPTRIGIFIKEAVGTETGTVTVTVTGNNVSAGQIHRYTKTLSNWDVDITGGADTAGGTAFSVLTGTVPAGWIAANDILHIVNTFPTDTNPTWGTLTMTAQGGGTITLGAPTVITTATTASGQDLGGRTIRTTPSASTQAAGTLTVLSTLSGTTTNAHGPLAIVRLRDFSPTPPGTASAPSASIAGAAERVDVTSPASYPSDTTSWNLEESVNGGGYVNVATGVGLSATTQLSNRLATAAYTYRMVAVGAGGSTNGTASSAVTPNPDFPVYALNPGLSKNTVSITQKAYAAQYKIYRGLSGGSRSLVHTSTTQSGGGSYNWDDTGLTNGIAYDYHVITSAQTPTVRDSAASGIQTSTPANVTQMTPIADITNGWAAVGDTSLWSALNEDPALSGAGDTSYANAPINGAAFEVKFATFNGVAPPSAVQVKTVYSNSTGRTWTVGLYQGTTLIGSGTIATGQVGTHTLTLTSQQIANITDWSDLRMRCTFASTNIDAGEVYSTRLYVTPGPAKPISIVAQASGVDTGTNTPSTGSLTPANDKMLLAVAASRAGASPDDSFVVTGGGMTWTKEATVTYSARRRLTLFSGRGTPTTGNITMTYTPGSGETLEEIVWHLEAVDTGGLDFTATPVTGTQGGGTTLAAGPATGYENTDIVYAVGGFETTDSTITSGTSWNELTFTDWPSNVRRVQSMYSINGDTTPDWTWATGGNGAAAIAVVLRGVDKTKAAFGAAGTYVTGAFRTNVDVPVPANVREGSVILVDLYLESDSALGTLPTGFTQKTFAENDTSGQAFRKYTFWKRATGNDTGNYSFITPGAWQEAVAIRYDGVITTGDPFDGAPVHAASTSMQNPSPAVSMTPAAGSIAILSGALYGAISTGVSNSDAFTERVEIVGQDLYIATKEFPTSTSTGSLTMTNGVTTSWTSSLMALKTEATVTVEPIVASDTLSASVADVASVVITTATKTASDTLSASVSETSGFSTVNATASDTLSVSVSETASVPNKGNFATDTLSVIVTDVANVAKTDYKIATDTLSAAVNESVNFNAQPVAASDTLSASVIDAGVAFVQAPAADSLVITMSESTDIVIGGTIIKSASDTLSASAESLGGALLWSINFSGISSGAFPLTGGWQSNDNSWQVYQGDTGGGHSDVLYNSLSWSNLWRDAAADVSVQAQYKTSQSYGSVGGLAARIVDGTHYVSFELVKHEGGIGGVPTPESKLSIAIRNGGPHYEYTVAAPWLAYETYYNIELRVYGNIVEGWVDGTLYLSHTLDSTEQAALAGGIGAGAANFAGNANYDSMSATSIGSGYTLFVTQPASDTLSAAVTENRSFGTVTVTATDTLSASVSDTGTLPPIAIVASDSLAAAVNDTGLFSPVQVYSLDDLVATVNEGRVLSSMAPAADTLIAQVTETSQVAISGLVTKAASDTLTAGVTESSSFATVAVTGTDNLNVTITDVGTFAPVTVTATDALNAQVTETRNFGTVTVTATDTLAASVTENRSFGTVTVVASDALNAAVNESVNTLSMAPGVDGLYASVTETALVDVIGIVEKTASDNLTAAVTETTQFGAIAVSASDTLSAKVGTSTGTRYTIFTPDRVPGSNGTDSAYYVLGTGFNAPVGSSITAVRVYHSGDQPEIGRYQRRWTSLRLWGVTGQTVLRNQTIALTGTAAGWQEFTLTTPYVVTGTEGGFFATVYTNSLVEGSSYPFEYGVLNGIPIESGLPGFNTWPDGAAPYRNGAFGVDANDHIFPTQSFAQSWYGIDPVVYSAGGAGEETGQVTLVTLSASDTLNAEVSENISFATVPVSASDTLAVNLYDDTTFGETPITASDTLSAAVTEAVVLVKAFPGNDTLIAQVTETANVVITGQVDKAASDTLTAAATETVATLVTWVGTSDALTASVTEARSFGTVQVVASDALVPVVFEGAAIFNGMPGNDTLAVTLSESTNIVVGGTFQKEASDNLYAHVDEVSSFDTITRNASDTLSASVTEARQFATVQVIASDTLSASVNDVKTNLVSLPGFDNLLVTLTETAQVQMAGDVSKSASDTLSVNVTETRALLVPRVASDTLIPAYMQEGAYFWTPIQVVASDDLSVALTETRQFAQMPIAASDTLQASVTETSGFAPVQVVVTDLLRVSLGDVVGRVAQMPGLDNLNVTVVETANVQVTGTINKAGTDTLAIQLTAEAIQPFFIKVALSDTLAARVTDVGSFGLGDVQASDALTVTLSEQVQILVAQQISASDDLFAAVIETSDNRLHLASFDDLIIRVTDYSTPPDKANARDKRPRDWIIDDNDYFSGYQGQTRRRRRGE